MNRLRALAAQVAPRLCHDVRIGEPALRCQLPLAAQDDALRSAALAAGVACIEAPV